MGALEGQGHGQIVFITSQISTKVVSLCRCGDLKCHAMKKTERKSAQRGLSRRQLLYTAAGAAAVPALRPIAPQTSKLRLTMACWDYDRTRALRESRVAFDGIELTYLPLVVEETF